MLDTKIETKVEAWQVAPQVGKRYTFNDTRGNVYLCEVDMMTRDGKVFAFVENMEAFNGWSYQRIDKLTLCQAPSWLQFSREVDTAWIELMRDDQLNPEEDVEFVRNEYLKVWIR